mmetsp:Transcript_64651/g.154541  ORF Transcript_64651/g.154541 Transcript_64651/m.154541 type:complete len:207 (-) Transcript_64651:6-626(-)
MPNPTRRTAPTTPRRQTARSNLRSRTLRSWACRRATARSWRPTPTCPSPQDPRRGRRPRSLRRMRGRMRGTPATTTRGRLSSTQEQCHPLRCRALADRRPARGPPSSASTKTLRKLAWRSRRLGGWFRGKATRPWRLSLHLSKNCKGWTTGGTCTSSLCRTRRRPIVRRPQYRTPSWSCNSAKPLAPASKTSKASAGFRVPGFVRF